MRSVKTLAVIDCCAPVAGPVLSDSEAGELERLFSVLADRQRIKILNLLASADDDSVCVCELVPALDLKQPTVSYHLKQLAQAGLVERERRGTFAYYRLVPGALERIGAVLR
jgi:ArsR family transcriptional regulator, arsenate/arsenite/antimonite-responsive transcriptional repressor